jgi:glycosyltransferase involved in cell wall biosynthesis
MYRIAFVCDWDATDPSAMSGYAFSMRRAFLEAGHEMLDVFPAERNALSRAALGVGLLLKMYFKLQGIYHSAKRETVYLKAAAMYTEKRLRLLGHYDFVFAPSAVPLALARINKPIFYTADQPFDAYVQEYIRNPSHRFLRIGRSIEKLLVDKSRAVIYPSQWAADKFLEVHPRSAAKVRIIQWGANLPVIPSKSEVMNYIRNRRTEECLNLVFIGRDWERKGGQLAVDIGQMFHSKGHRCKLSVIGANPSIPSEFKGEVIPFIDKTSNKGLVLLNTILNKSHFLIVPSRAEAYGQVFCEAAAFGVPVVTTAVGGIPSIIRDGENGICLPKSAPAEAYYQRMLGIFLDREAYGQMACNAYAAFRERLNWPTFVNEVLKLASESVQDGK